MNRNGEILSRRLYSPSLKDIALLERAQLFFLIFDTFVCHFFFSRTASRRLSIYRQMYVKSEKSTGCLLPKPHPSNVVNTIFYLIF